MLEAKKKGILVKRFAYDYEKFKSEQENKTKLESKLEALKVTFVGINIKLDSFIIKKLFCI